MSKYEKIAEWIISQNVNRVLRSKDIKEIAETLFDTKLTDTGVKKVKEALLDRDYTNIKDMMPSMEPIDYIKEALDKEGIKYEIEDDIYGSSAPFDTWITITEGDDSRADDIICSVVGEAYEWVRDKDGNRRYCKVVTDPDLIDEFNDTSIKDSNTKIKDDNLYAGKIFTSPKGVKFKVLEVMSSFSDVNGKPYINVRYEVEIPGQKKFVESNYIETFFKYIKGKDGYDNEVKDSIKDSNSLVGKKISWDRRALYGVILSENDPLTNKTTIEETSTGKVYFVSTRLLNKAIDNGEAKIRDSKLEDAKLTRKQKLWYAEELEKFIKPEYLKRNYTLKRLKRRRK